MKYHTPRVWGQTRTTGEPATAAAADIAADNDPLTLIPTTILPAGPARRALAASVRLGADTDACQVYHPRNREQGWQTPENLHIWLAPPDPAWDTRMTPAEWLTAYTTATSGPAGEEMVELKELHARYQRLKSFHALHSLTPLLWDRAGSDEPNSVEQTVEQTGEPSNDDHHCYPARRPEEAAAETALEHAITVRWWLQRAANLALMNDVP